MGRTSPTSARTNSARRQSTPLGLFPLRANWTLALNNALTTPPAFSGLRGYFAIEHDRLVAYDLERGEQLWLVPAQPIWQPVVGDGLVFLVYPGAIAALDERSGSEVWRLPLAEPLAVRPVWDNGWLIAATLPGTVLAFRALDGHQIWRREAGARVSAPPALAADRVYVPLQDRRVLALRIEDGAVAWERRLGGPATDMLALEDRVYVGATDNFLYCLRTDRGEIDWRWRTGADVIGAPVADQERVYFVSLDNILRGLDRTGGSQEWKRPLPMRPRGGPLLAPGTLIVGGLAPTLRAYAAANGAPAGEIALPADLAAPPHLYTGGALPVLIAVTTDIANGATVLGFIRAMEPATQPMAPLPNPMPPPAVTIPP